MSRRGVHTSTNPADAWVRQWSDGDACYALWQDNLWCQAVIVDKRPAEGVPSLLQQYLEQHPQDTEVLSSSSEAKTDASASMTAAARQVLQKKLLSARKWEYYVHFSDFNRRLDRWVHVDDIKDAVNPHLDSVLGINVVATPQGYKSMWGGGMATSASAAQAAQQQSAATAMGEVAEYAGEPTAGAGGLASALSPTGMSGVWPPGTLIHAGMSPAAGAVPAGSWSPASSAAAGAQSESGFGSMSAASMRGGSQAGRVPRAALRREKTRGIVSEGAPPLDAADVALEKEHEERTKVKNIDLVQFGKYEIDAWYYSPYPDEYKQCHRLFVCEFCLKYMRSARLYLDHTAKCVPRHPPGVEIYRKDKISVWELDGGQQRLYCQCLCLLSKLFIDHKTLYYDVEPFYFYVMTETDEEGSHIVGYFSKEKASTENYNVACILTFPQHQRKGFGRFLIDFSYALTKIEGGVGSPEKPLSDLGKLSYRAYWTQKLLKTMAATSPKEWTVPRLSQLTAITQEDVAGALHSLNLLQYARGQHYVDASPRLVEQLVATHCKGKELELDSSLIQWEPHPVQSTTRKRVRRSKADTPATAGAPTPGNAKGR